MTFDIDTQGAGTNVTFRDLTIRNGGNSGFYVTGSNTEVGAITPCHCLECCCCCCFFVVFLIGGPVIRIHPIARNPADADQPPSPHHWPPQVHFRGVTLANHRGCQGGVNGRCNGGALHLREGTWAFATVMSGSGAALCAAPCTNPIPSEPRGVMLDGRGLILATGEFPPLQVPQSRWRTRS